MRIIALGNQKGGVGKTTTTLNLGHALAERERRVLLVDMDPQASLTVACGVGDCAGASLAEVLLGGKSMAEILKEVASGIMLAPGDIAMSEAELIMIAKFIGRETALKKALATVARRFDYALLDLPPSLGILTINGLAAADQVLIPAIPQFLDQRALAIFFKTIDNVKAEINPRLSVMGILPTFYDSRLNLHADILATWDAGGLNILPQRVRRSVRLAESPVDGQPVATYAPEYAEPYRQLAEMIDHG